MPIDDEGVDGESTIACLSYYKNIESKVMHRENNNNKTKSKGLQHWLSSKGNSAHMFIGIMSTQGKDTQ